MLNKYLALLFLIWCSLSANAQGKDPVHFSFQIEKTGNNIFNIRIIGNIDKGWHIYSKSQPKEAISIPTDIIFIRNPLIILIDSLIEFGNRKMQNLKQVGIKQYYFAGKVLYVQKIQLKANVKTNLSGSISYQACTDEICLPAKTITFTIAVP